MNVTSKPERDLEPLSLAGMLRDQTICGVVVVDAKKIIRSLTLGAEQLLGLIPGQTAGTAADTLPAPLYRLLRGVFTSAKIVEARTVAFTTAAGIDLKLQVTALPLIEGKPDSGAVLVLTEAAGRQLDQKIRRLDRLASIGTLSASTAHEIKNALVAVKTFIDLLLEKNQDAELVEIVRREMQRINALVSQTLKYAVPGRPQKATVAVHDVLDHSLRIVQPHCDKKLISLKREFNAPQSTVRGDDYQLEQVFVNLFLNAVEATGVSGSLRVATEIVEADAHPCLCVTVTDSGVGISPEGMRHLFEPFFTTKENGTGLGLAISQKIVEEHHGTITAESRPNQGTSFRVLLPLQTA